VVTNRIPLRCIGGPKDGDILLLPEGQGYVAVQDNPFPVFRDPGHTPEGRREAVDLTRYEYRVESIQVGKRTFRMLVEQSLTVADAVERLLLAYAPRFK
jgi:hypothetical protein